MRKNLKSYLVAILFILICSLISSLVLAILKQNALINGDTLFLTLILLSLLIFFVGAIILGLKQKNRGLINGFIFFFLYFCLYLLSGSNFETFRHIIVMISKGLLLVLGSIIGVNLKKA